MRRGRSNNPGRVSVVRIVPRGSGTTAFGNREVTSAKGQAGMSPLRPDLIWNLFPRVGVRSALFANVRRSDLWLSSGAMKYLSSFHGGHSTYGDGRATVRDMAHAAAERGLFAFGFTEHFDRPPSDRYLPRQELGPLADRGEWIASYVRDVRALQDEFVAAPSIRLGVEVDYIRGAELWTQNAISKCPFEYIVGSVHFVRYEDQDICIDYSREYTDEALLRAGSAEHLQLHYYDHILELLDWDLIQIVGHLDVVKKYLSPDEASPTSRIQTRVVDVLDVMRGKGVALDVNPVGLRRPCKDIFPAHWILEEAARIGVPVTLGDDSHSVDQVGRDLEPALRSIIAAGYRSLCVIDPDGQLETLEL